MRQTQRRSRIHDATPRPDHLVLPHVLRGDGEARAFECLERCGVHRLGVERFEQVGTSLVALGEQGVFLRREVAEERAGRDVARVGKLVDGDTRKPRFKASWSVVRAISEQVAALFRSWRPAMASSCLSLRYDLDASTSQCPTEDPGAERRLTGRKRPATLRAPDGRGGEVAAPESRAGERRCLVRHVLDRSSARSRRPAGRSW